MRTIWEVFTLRISTQKEVEPSPDCPRTPSSCIYSCQDSRLPCECSIGSISSLQDCDLFQWHYNCYFCLCVCVCVFSQLVVNGSLWLHESVAYQVPLSMRILQEGGQEWGCHFPLQGTFLTQGSNPHLLCLLNWEVDFSPVRHLGSCFCLSTLN